MPEVRRVLLMGVNISLKGRACDMETRQKLKTLLHFTFYLLDKLRRFKLSKEVCISSLKDSCPLVAFTLIDKTREIRQKLENRKTWPQNNTYDDSTDLYYNPKHFLVMSNKQP